MHLQMQMFQEESRALQEELQNVQAEKDFLEQQEHAREVRKQQEVERRAERIAHAKEKAQEAHENRLAYQEAVQIESQANGDSRRAPPNYWAAMEQAIVQELPNAARAQQVDVMLGHSAWESGPKMLLSHSEFEIQDFPAPEIGQLPQPDAMYLPDAATDVAMRTSGAIAELQVFHHLCTEVPGFALENWISSAKQCWYSNVGAVNDRAGCDFQFTDTAGLWGEQGSVHSIEVKCAIGGPEAGFYISANEVAKARECAAAHPKQCYHIYVVSSPRGFNVNDTATLERISNPSFALIDGSSSSRMNTIQLDAEKCHARLTYL